MLGHWHQERWVIPTLLVRVVGGLITTILLAGLLGGCGESSTQVKEENPTNNESSSASKTSKKATAETEKTAVEETVRNYYRAIEAQDYEEAYTYFGPNYRESWGSQQEYVASSTDMAKDYNVEDFTIIALEVGNVSENGANAAIETSSTLTDSDTVYHYVERWKLVKEGGQWKLNESTFEDLTPLTVIPLGIKLTDIDAEPGWQNVTIPFGVRNDNFMEDLVVEFPSPPRVSIEEGRTYGFEMPYEISLLDPDGPFDGFQLPPHFALCGVVMWDESDKGTTDVERLQATGQTPVGTTLTALKIKGYTAADLTNKMSYADCAPTEIVDLPEDDITLFAEGVSASASQSASASASQSASASASQSASAADWMEARLHVEGVETLTKIQDGTEYARTVLAFTLKNQNKLDNFNVEDFRIWLLDEDGVARSPFVEPQMDVPADTWCDYDYNPMTVSVGPSQEQLIRVCFPFRPGHHAAAVLFESQDLGIHEVVVPTVVKETS